MQQDIYLKRINSNIWKMYIVSIVHWFILTIPILVLFFQDNGLSMAQVFLLQAIFSVIIVIFEIPSGYFADKIGRKISIVLAAILVVIALAVYSFSYSFFGFMIAEIIYAVGAGFISGADSALLYDSLVELKREDEYKAVEGRMSAFGNFSEGIASIIGGFIALISFRHAFYVETFTMMIGIFVALSLTEPRRHPSGSNDAPMKELLKAVKYALHDNKEIKWLMIYSGMLSIATYSMVWFIQPYWKQVGVPLAMFGILWAILQFSVGGFSLLAHKIEKYFGKAKTIVVLAPLVVIAYLGLAFSKSIWAIGFIFIFYLVRGIRIPLFNAYINELVPSHIRATVLSVGRFVNRMIFVIFGPFIGWFADVYTMEQAFLMSALFFFICCGVSLFFMRKCKTI